MSQVPGALHAERAARFCDLRLQGVPAAVKLVGMHAGATLGAGACADGQCSADGSAGSAALNPGSWDYSGVLSQQRNAGIAFSGESVTPLVI